jgi:hypothetical protein
VYLIGHGHLTRGGGTGTARFGEIWYTAEHIATRLNRHLPEEVERVFFAVCLGGQTRWYGLRPSMAWELHVRTGLRIVAGKGECYINDAGRMVARGADGTWLDPGVDLYVSDKWWRFWGTRVK